MLVRGADEPEQQHDPGERDDEARDDQRPLRVPLGEPLGGEGREEDAERRRGEDHAGLDRAVAANLLQEDGDDERDPISTSHWMFWVTRARLQVRFRNSPVESSASLPARSRARM